MEINALFDLWDEFNPHIHPALENGNALTTPFYRFPIGTDVYSIMDWFLEQNPFFAIKPAAPVNGKWIFSVYCNPNKPE